MSTKLRAWIASPKETRTAWIVASFAIAVVAGAFLWPDLNPDNNTRPESADQRPESIKEIIVAAQKQEKHQVRADRIKTEQIKSEETAVAAPPDKTTVQKSASQPTPKAVVAKSAASKPKPATKSTSGYYVQLGAFKERQRAISLQKRLASHWKTILKEKSNSMVAVWAGPYPSSKDAETARRSIAMRTKIKGFIVKN